MAFPKIKLCWNRPGLEADWHLGVVGVYTRGLAGGRLRGLIISLRGLLAWLAGLAVVAYFTGAAALWFWLDRNPYNQVAYADLVLPTRWNELQKLRGRAMIAEGLDDIKARKWTAGFQKLRGGIARNPEEIEARLTLAGMFLAMKARPQAIKIYDGGLARRYPGRDYIETMLKSAMQSENFGWALRTCDRALALIADDPEHAFDRRWLIRQKLAALIAAERTAEALALAGKEGESGSPAIAEFRVLALLQAGKSAEALAFLSEWSERNGDRADPQILRLQVRAFREAGDIAGMDRALEDLRALSPTDPRPYVYGIVQRLLVDRRADSEVALDVFLRRFGSRTAYLQILAAPLAEIAEVPMLERLIAHARRHGFDSAPFRRFLVQSLIASAEWRKAAKVLAETEDALKKTEAAASWYEIMNAQIQAALDPADGAQANLAEAVRGRQFTLSLYKSVIANMRRAGRPATAREIITFAQGVYPENTTIETWRTELDEELAAIEAAKPVVAPIRRPTDENRLDVPVIARVELKEEVFVKRLETLVEAADYAGALQCIREARISKPAWLDDREAMLSRDEVRFSGLAGDILMLRTAVRMYNNGDHERSAQMIEMARELNTAGRKEEALYLLRELLAKAPDYPIAERLLVEWTAAATATP